MSYLAAVAFYKIFTQNIDIIVQWVLTVLMKIGWILVEYPVHALYFNGPSFHNYGFYESKSLDLICYELTNVPAIHWQQNLCQCQSLLERKFHAFIVFIYFIIYISMAILTVLILYIRCLRRVMPL